MTDTIAPSTGTILHLQRLSTEDGPGIRTTVFFKGCPLHCAWCHNPESISPRPQAQWLSARCIGCESCVGVCPQHGLARAADGRIARDRARCTACGACAEECPGGAMELLGTKMDAGALVKELLKDRAYFDKSGGGVTLSGGEPTFQAEFAAALCEQLRGAGISVALDTCGLCPPRTLERLLEFVDVVLYDLKLIDPAEHARWTGVDNRQILANLRLVGESLNSDQALWVRTPLIPGATLSEANLRGIGDFLAEHLPGKVERWELCAFNNLCREQYRRLGLEWAFAAEPLLSRAELDQAGAWARASGFDPEHVFVTGSAR
jgi:pyruvate formate lyase activating enzyme